MTKINPNSFKSIRNNSDFKEQIGPTQFAKKHIDSTALSAFHFIFDDSMVKMISSFTKIKAEEQKEPNFEFNNRDLLRFIAVLLAKSLFSERVPIRQLWSKQFSIPFITQFMSRNYFIKVMKYLRFDDVFKRSERYKKDKFHPVRELWNKFISNSAACYKPNRCLTVDEQLLPCKSRCSFIQYMPNKPASLDSNFGSCAK